MSRAPSSVRPQFNDGGTARRGAHPDRVPTPAERQALLFVATLAALGVGVRACRALGTGPATAAPAADREALAAQLAAVDSALVAGGARRPRRAPDAKPEPVAGTGRAGPAAVRAPREARRGGATDGLPMERFDTRPNARSSDPIDVDRADAATLDLLPGIGPALAARIVADRDSLGPFGSLEALQRVRGIGPALAARLGPRVTFSGPPRPTDTESRARGRVSRP